MEKIQETIQKLQQENDRLRQEILSLKEQLQGKPEKQTKLFIDEPFPQLIPLPVRNLTNEEISRYGRQLILRDVGIQGRV
jgi:cell division septum initiation protein DivIVA